MRAPRAAERVNVLYAWVRLISRFWVWFFFKTVDVRHPERVPATGPVLLCINHPNNLIDSLLVGAVLDRKVHYLATAALFRNPLVARFLLACGAIPVYRKQDELRGEATAGADRNVEAFAACFRALGAGGLIGIYPEGTTHAEPRVQRIRTGAARIALEFEGRRAGHPSPAAPLAVIPVGLTFEARKSFGARVLVSFGEAISVAPYLESYASDPVKAVDALTTAIQWGMESQVVAVKRIDSAALIRAVEDLYRGDLVRELQEERGLSTRQIDTLRLSRAIVDAAHFFEDSDPERVERLWQRIQGYRAKLAAYRIRDEAVRGRLRRPERAEQLRRGWQASAGLPLFAYGAVVSGVPYLVPRWVARRMSRKETDYATTRLLASMVAFPLFWGAEAWLVWWLAGPGWALAFALSLPLSSLAAYRYLGGVGRLRGELQLGALALTRRQTASRLLAARQAIIAELEQAKNDYLAATKGSSF
ncbi:MAG: 1-acyl-sn-glycerol-3-phosphate acyltransferase [Candidatus Rokubacteria bacterium]|nr:1-acyl-sn-glycerol-3-phosphate acyltransferase [Candidatus Rokubacteria bacterium]